jgi:hypothetical protein
MLAALRLSLDRVLELGRETEDMLEFLTQELEEISTHARRERQNRP